MISIRWIVLAKLAALQDKLPEDMNSRYADFEKAGWWWYRSLKTKP